MLRPISKRDIFLDLVPKCGTMFSMKKKHQKTLNLIFARPVSSNVKWNDVVSLIGALGGEIKERKEGSAVVVILDDAVLYDHKPHPSPDMDKGAVAALRTFLSGLGYKGE